MRARLSAILLLAILTPGAALAWSEPPVRDARDAACRDEARSKVFSAPDPQGVGLFETGKRIYYSCMAAGAKSGKRLADAEAGSR